MNDDSDDPMHEERRAALGARSEIEPADARIRLLIGGSAAAVLERIRDGDPLELLALAEERIHQNVVFLGTLRVAARTAARIAFDAASEPHVGRPSLHGWLVARVDRSIAELVAEDARASALGHPLEELDEPFYARFSEATGIDPAQARGACIAFNQLDSITREAFYCVSFESQPVALCAKMLGESVRSVELRVAAAARIFLEAQAPAEDPGSEDR